MSINQCVLVGAPMDSGKTRKGCLMGPDAYRTAQISRVINEFEYEVEDRGNVTPDAFEAASGMLHVSLDVDF